MGCGWVPPTFRPWNQPQGTVYLIDIPMICLLGYSSNKILMLSNKPVTGFSCWIWGVGLVCRYWSLPWPDAQGNPNSSSSSWTTCSTSKQHRCLQNQQIYQFTGKQQYRFLQSQQIRVLQEAKTRVFGRWRVLHCPWSWIKYKAYGPLAYVLTVRWV